MKVLCDRVCLNLQPFNSSKASLLKSMFEVSKLPWSWLSYVTDFCFVFSLILYHTLLLCIELRNIKYFSLFHITSQRTPEMFVRVSLSTHACVIHKWNLRPKTFKSAKKWISWKKIAEDDKQCKENTLTKRNSNRRHTHRWTRWRNYIS